MESKSWKVSMGKKFVLKKDETIMIPECLKEIRVGLGWDTHCDIDASIICFDKDGNIVDLIFFN